LIFLRPTSQSCPGVAVPPKLCVSESWTPSCKDTKEKKSDKPRRFLRVCRGAGTRRTRFRVPAREARPCSHTGQCRKVMGICWGEHGCPPRQRRHFAPGNDEFVHSYNALLGLGLHLQQAELWQPKLPIWPLQLFFFLPVERKEKTTKSTKSCFLKKEVSILKATNRLCIGNTFWKIHSFRVCVKYNVKVLKLQQWLGSKNCPIFNNSINHM